MSVRYCFFACLAEGVKIDETSIEEFQSMTVINSCLRKLQPPCFSFTYPSFFLKAVCEEVYFINLCYELAKIWSNVLRTHLFVTRVLMVLNSTLCFQAFLQMCNLPIRVVCRANAEYMSPSGKCGLHLDYYVIPPFWYHGNYGLSCW